MTTIETLDSHDHPVVVGNQPEQHLPSRPPVEAPVDALVLDLSQRLADLREHAQQHTSAAHSTLVKQVDICSTLLELIDTQAGEMRRRLTKAESLLHEQSLQLRARVSESHTDALTGIANRRAFDQHLHERCAALRRITVSVR